jgi:hypothetical protein
MTAQSCSATYDAIQRFLRDAKQPVLLEAGLEPIPLTEGSYEVLLEGERLSVQAWTVDRSLFRRIVALEAEGAGKVQVTIQRFGNRTGTLQFVDQGRPAAEKLTRRASRLSFREVFRRFLSRQFSGWQVVDLTTEADLQHSFSSAYTRALIRRGAAGLAAIGASDSTDADGALTYGLIWLDYLRRREPKLTVEGLVLLLPERHERTTSHRIRHLDGSVATYSVFVRSAEWEHPIDIADAGNVDTELARRDSGAWIPEWLRPVQAIEGVETVECADGISFRVCGLEFARCHGADVRFGLGGRRPGCDYHAIEIANLARELIRARHASNREHPLYAPAPERWLESVLRRNVTKIDAGLHSGPVYGQAPTFRAGERGVIDLLAAGFDGRLAVIEVKATEDPHLPLQALEYWARVKWHHERGEFTSRGYFPDMPLSTAPPRILLVAPALHFHPSTETILRFFPKEIEVARIGVSSGWRSELSVAFRALELHAISVAGPRYPPAS